jgi:hypothetical protein
MNASLYWFLVFMAASGAYSMLQSDASKLKSWHERDEAYVLADRIVTVTIVGFIVWQLWGAK